MDLNVLNQRFKQGKGLNFASIRLPHTQDVYFFYATENPVLSKISLNHASPVFVCSPYGAGNLTYHLIPDVVYRNEELIHGEPAAIEGVESPSCVSETSNHVLDKAAYLHYVAASIKEMKRGELDKIVAARCNKVILKDGFSAASLYKDLCDQYPDACVYHFSLADGNSWIGATPEKLLGIKNKELTTVALAGTMKSEEERDWTPKEQQEQAITAGFIRDLFKKQVKKGWKETAVESVNAGNLKHLQSGFCWKADQAELLQKFPKILAELNPTPAVCGIPMMAAAGFIAQHEGMERRFYSGFVGLINSPSDASLFVNLRCMEFNNQEGILYAGAGITPDSDAEMEWEETGNKMQTLLRLME